MKNVATKNKQYLTCKCFKVVNDKYCHEGKGSLFVGTTMLGAHITWMRV